MRTPACLRRLLLVVPLLAAGIALGTPAPAGAATECNSTGPITYADTTVRDGLVVPPGGFCAIVSTTVRGGITVGAGGSLHVFGSEVRGPIAASAPNAVGIEQSVVRGGVTVTGAAADPSDGVVVAASEVRGDVVVSGVTTERVINVQFNTVRGSVVLRGNSANRVFVLANEIYANLDCAENAPDPIDEDIPNTVGGVASGECAGLVAP